MNGCPEGFAAEHRHLSHVAAKVRLRVQAGQSPKGLGKGQWQWQKVGPAAGLGLKCQQKMPSDVRWHALAVAGSAPAARTAKETVCGWYHHLLLYTARQVLLGAVQATGTAQPVNLHCQLQQPAVVLLCL